MSLRRPVLAAVAGACALVPLAAAAEVTLSNAWLRPTAGGQKQAQVYVDIRADEPMKLVAARSPIANHAELVLLDPPQADTGKLRVVDEIAIPANRETRLAYLGSHVRLVEVTRAAVAGERVPLQLTFVDAGGRRRIATTEALVRGLVARRPDGTEIRTPSAGN